MSSAIRRRFIRRRPLPLVLALLLCPTLSPAGKAATPPQRKLAVQILITAPPKQAARPGQPGQKPPSPAPATAPKPVPIKVAERGKPLVAMVYFQDCQPNAAGKCNLVMDFHGETSKGVRFGDTKDAPLWRDRPAPKPGVAQAGSNRIGLTLEPSDPTGTYRFFVVVHDRNAGTEVKTETTFEVK